MDTKTKKKSFNSTELYIVTLVVIIVINIGLLFFLRTQVKTISLLRDQEIQLTQDQQIISSAEQIYEKYKNNIQLISDVFPSEEQVLLFLQTLESIAKQESDESSVKFASLSPQPEGDTLFLLFTIALKTDETRLENFLKDLESLPYMTRLLSITINYPAGQEGKIDVNMRLKLYVKNPFSGE